MEFFIRQSDQKRGGGKSGVDNFFAALITVFLSVGAFYAFKALLPSERLFAKTAHTYEGDNIAVDSVMLRAMADADETEPGVVTVAIELSAVEPTHTAVKPTAAETSAVELAAAGETTVEAVAVEDGENEESAAGGMSRFFQKLFNLEATKKGSVRVAYFGDSMIEGDLIVQDIRKGYQKKFGGQGVGFVPVSGLTPYLGTTIRYEYSPDWKTFSALKRSTAPLGINCYVSFAKTGASVWTRYRSGTLPLANPTLFYGHSEKSDAKMIVDTGNGVSDTVALNPVEYLNKRSLASRPRELMIRFDNADSIPFYGVNFSDGNGVIIDNFALRGSSGLPLEHLSGGLMNAFHREFDYDLIVLQFGANVLSSSMTKYDWYAKGMGKTTKHLKKCFPGADILVISQADKATKYGTEMRTDTTLALFIRAQERYARGAGAAFVNLFQLMGGEGSMVAWVNAKPSLAVTDYTHFNHAGARKIANLIFEKLDREYEEFKKQNNLSAVAEEGGNENASVDESNNDNESE